MQLVIAPTGLVQLAHGPARLAWRRRAQAALRILRSMRRLRLPLRSPPQSPPRRHSALAMLRNSPTEYDEELRPELGEANGSDGEVQEEEEAEGNEEAVEYEQVTMGTDSG